jgi:hypothetical protein
VHAGSAEMTIGCQSVSQELKRLLEISQALRESMEAIAGSTDGIQGDVRDVQRFSRGTEQDVREPLRRVRSYRLLDWCAFFPGLKCRSAINQGKRFVKRI